MEIPGLLETGRCFGSLLRRALFRACRPTLLLAIFCLAASRFVCAQSLPRISDNGITNGASFAQGPVAPGSIVSIFGSNFNLASGPHGGGATATALPLPTSIGGTKVTINGIAAPLFYVDSTQINAQVPWEVNGAASLAVQVMVNGVPSNLATVALAVQAPGIFVVTHALDGTAVTPANPALPSEYLTIYCAGLGPVASPPATGAAAAASPPSSTLVNPVVTIGGVAANVVFSGLTPGLVGLYQVNAQVPSGVPGGNDITVVLSIGGANSNTITTSVQPAVPSEVQVSVSPSSASVLTGGTQQFTATVAGTSNSSITWSVKGVPGGNSTVGTISASGLYTAPGSVPNPNLVFVAATSAIDMTSAGTATVAVSAPAVASSPLGKVRSAGPGLWVQFEERGWASGYWPGQAIQTFNDFDSVVGSTVAQEASLQLDKMKAMGLNAFTYEFRTTDDPSNKLPFVSPACPIGAVLGLQWPQPTSTELANLKAFFDLVQSKGMRIRLHLANTHMEESPPTNSQTWLGAILRTIGQHAALDVVMFDGDTHLVNTAQGLNTACGIPAEPPLWLGPRSVPAQYVEWAISYAISLGIPARKLSAEAIVGDFNTDSQTPAGPGATDQHLWPPLVTLKGIFDDLKVPDAQRTYALSFYEHRKCLGAPQFLSCADADPHTWAEQTLQNVFATIGTGNGARVVATEMGGNLPPVDPNWRTQNALESTVSLLEKYQIEGGSFWRWTSFSNCSSGCPNEDSDPTLDDPVKRRGVNFVYNPVQKEVLDWGGFHLTAIPNPSFEGDIDSKGVPSHWTVTGNGTGAAYFLAQEAGQPQVPSRGSYCLRLTTGNGAATVSALSEAIPVTPGTAYTTAANLRFSWTGDPNPSGSPVTRPQVFVTIHYLNGNGQPTATLPAVFSYFQENSTQGFQTFVFQYTPPFDAKSVQIEIGAARNGLAAPIILDADNLR